MIKHILLRVIIFVLAIEVFLRISGVVTPFVQELSNRLMIKKTLSSTVLFVGDSISLGTPAYSDKVETLLNNKLPAARSVHTVNQSMSAMSTGYILDNLPDWIAEFKPTIIVAMTGGINDESQYGHGIKKNVVSYHLRSVRLFMALGRQAIDAVKGWFIDPRKLHEKQQLSYQPIVSPKGEIDRALEYLRLTMYFMRHGEKQKASEVFLIVNDPNQKPYVKNFIGAVQTALYLEDAGHYSEAEVLFTKLASLDMDEESKKFLEGHVGEILWDEKAMERWLVYAAKVLDKDPYDGNVTLKLDRLCSEQIALRPVNLMLDKFMKEYPQKPRYLDLYASCASNQGDAAKAASLRAKALDLRKGLPQKSQENLRNIYKLTTEKEIPLILVQYPREDIGPLKSVFEGFSDTHDLYFVENKTNFERILAEKGYGFLFEDQCCGNYGHCTDYGKDLIAKEVSAVIFNILGGK